MSGAGAVCEPTFGFSLFGPLHVPASHIGLALENPDAIANAYSLGRLDLVSLLLGALTILIAAGAFTGFWMLRGIVAKRAEDEARTELGEVLPRELAAVLQKDPQLLATAIRNNKELVASIIAGADLNRTSVNYKLEGDANSRLADEVARAMEESDEYK